MKPASLLLPLSLALLGLPAQSGEPIRAQFPKRELDSLGYPTNTIMAVDLGRSDARRDLTNGVVRLPMYGLPAPWSVEFDRILAEKHHVGRFGLAGCVVSRSLKAYAHGYSEVNRRFIEERHGTNLWKEVQAEAETAYATRIETEAKARTEKQQVVSEAYRVKSGDTLSRIARRNGLILKSLQAANPGLDPKRLQVHQMLRLTSPSKHSDKP